MTPEWITAVSTVIYVAATISIVLSNRKIALSNKNMADSTQSQVHELQRQFHAHNRPYVCVRLEDVRNGLTCISIENNGNSPASNVRVAINESFLSRVANDRLQENLRKFTQSTAYLSPRQKLYCCLCGPAEFGSLKDQPMLIDLTYEGDKNKYEEHVEIDLKGYAWALLYESPLGDMASHIKNMSESMEKIQRKLPG
jgi:hypothetical protein